MGLPNIPDMTPILSATRQVATRSVLNPLLFLIALVAPASIICSTFAHAPINYLLFGLAVVTVLTGVWAYCYFAIKSPARLQSEGHLIQMATLSRIGGGGREMLVPIDDPVTDNPQLSIGAGNV